MTSTPPDRGVEPDPTDIDSELDREASAEEYEAEDESGGTSGETGVTYDEFGEPETTPEDEIPGDDEEGGLDAATSGDTEE
jgi:hypothetical protein